jgi:hypothetical protein
MRSEASRFTAFVPALLIFAAVSVLIVLHVVAYQPLSPFDEGVHFDYVIKASEGDIVRRGEKLGEEAMLEIACRGIDLKGLVVPRCDARSFDPEMFPGEGFSSAEVHPPLYYGITGILARGLVATGIAPDMFAASRLVGILWLGLGLLIIWIIGKELGVATLPLALVIASVGAAPTLLHASATVSNDATGLVAGGLLAWVTLRWEKGSSPLWLLGLVSFLALALKTTNGLAVGLCALYLFIRPRLSDRSSQPRRSNRAGIAVLLGAAALSLFAWVVIHGLLATTVDIPTDDPSGGLRLFDVFAQLTVLITPLTYGLPTSLLGATAYDAATGILGVLMIGATVGPILRGELSERWERLAASTGITMLLGGALFALASYAVYNRVTVSPRYGLSVIPLLAVVLAAAIRTRAVLWGLGVFAAGQLGFVLWAILRA